MIMWDYDDELLQANIYTNLDELDNLKNHNFQNWHKLRREFEYPCKYWKVEFVVKYLPTKKTLNTGKFCQTCREVITPTSHKLLQKNRGRGSNSNGIIQSKHNSEFKIWQRCEQTENGNTNISNDHRCKLITKILARKIQESWRTRIYTRNAKLVSKIFAKSVNIIHHLKRI